MLDAATYMLCWACVTGLAINVSMATCIKVLFTNLCLAFLPLLITIALLSKDPTIHSCCASVCIVPFSWLLQLHVCPKDILMIIKREKKQKQVRLQEINWLVSKSVILFVFRKIGQNLSFIPVLHVPCLNTACLSCLFWLLRSQKCKIFIL